MLRIETLAELLEHVTHELESIVDGNEPEKCKPARVIELCGRVLTTLSAQHVSREEANRLASFFDTVASSSL